MNIKKPIAALFLSYILFLPLSASAHSFEIAVVAPFTGENANHGIDLWNGMRVATRERDGHDFETSDGHLGGVDSHLLRFDTESDKASLAKRISKMGNDQGFIIAVFSHTSSSSNFSSTDLISMIPDNVPYIAIMNEQVTESKRPSSFQNSNILTPALVSGKSENAFEDNYLEQYKQSVNESALVGYTAARLIDAAIRQTDGDFTHSEAVQKAFMKAIRTIDNLQ